jgi:hypothetical protein
VSELSRQTSSRPGLEEVSSTALGRLGGGVLDGASSLSTRRRFDGGSSIGESAFRRE